MTFTTFLADLANVLSREAKVVTDSSSDEFKTLLTRWSDLGLKIPGAIVVVATEEDVVAVVKLAVELSIPFVPKSGGHSLWSTVDETGFILDLSAFKGVVVDKDAKTATFQGGATIGDVYAATVPHQLFVPLGNANGLGAVPQAIGGGITSFSAFCGSTSDSIISASVVTATGSLVTTSATSNSELFWALRGAGQFFGVVTSLTMKAYPISVLGTTDGTIFTGQLVFPASRIDDIMPVLIPMTIDESIPWLGLMILASPPPAFQPCLILAFMYFGSTSEGEKLVAPLKALGPIMETCTRAPFERLNDMIEPWCVPGGFKRFSGAGMDGKHFKVVADNYKKIILEPYETLLKSTPSAAATAYALAWNFHVSPTRSKLEETAFSHRDVKGWVELISWYTDETDYEAVLDIEQLLLSRVREGQPIENRVAYQNWTRAEPIELRYRGTERLEKLKTLKKQWDPKGIYTRELL
ncbi:hypothetical protein C8J56DRAFT_859692 [Mycena floridula]|nr:hypothetical protein C8J56DRAFT_859692 [Mycena floridula]